MSSTRRPAAARAAVGATTKAATTSAARPARASQRCGMDEDTLALGSGRAMRGGVAQRRWIGVRHEARRRVARDQLVPQRLEATRRRGIEAGDRRVEVRERGLRNPAQRHRVEHLVLLHDVTGQEADVAEDDAAEDRELLLAERAARARELGEQGDVLAPAGVIAV